MDKIKIFISYCHDDINKMKSLLRFINKSKYLTPIVVANNRSPREPLANKVIHGLENANIIVPILTRKSFTTQWVNQEIGYANCLDSIKIYPIVESQLLNKLKGFIHKQQDLPYCFVGYQGDAKKERSTFRAAVKTLLADIEEEFIPEEYMFNESNPTLQQKPNFQSLEISDKSLIYSMDKISLANPNFNSSLTGKFLMRNNGTISIWAQITNIHNKTNSAPKYLYILGYATNKGVSQKDPKMARYPNAWYISRITPTPAQPTGLWKFACNGIESEITEIKTKKLYDGWHLFTVSWNRAKNRIQFYIDKELIGNTKFNSWPLDFTGSLTIGTWPNRSRSNFFNSGIGYLKIFDVDASEQMIHQLYNMKTNYTIDNK